MRRRAMLLGARRRVGSLLRAVGLRRPIPVVASEKPAVLAPVALALLGMAAERTAVGGPGVRLVQIGANPSDGDPVQCVFDLLGPDARMLLIEAHPAAFERLCEKFRDDERVLPVQAFVGAAGEGLYALRPEFEARYHAVTGRPADRISSGDYGFLAPRLARRLSLTEDRVDQVIERVDTPVRSLREILEAHDFTAFDVLQIDAEGKDADILASFDPREFGCRIINFESAWLDAGDDRAIRRLEGMGFFQVAATGDSLCLRLGAPSGADPID